MLLIVCVMNAAARMLCSAGKYSNVSGLIRDRLHWLHVSQRIRFELCLIMYKATHGSAPVYLFLNSASSPALKVALGHLLVATWWFSGREQSSVNAHLSSRVRRHGTSYRAPSATLHP